MGLAVVSGLAPGSTRGTNVALFVKRTYDIVFFKWPRFSFKTGFTCVEFEDFGVVRTTFIILAWFNFVDFADG